MRRIRHLRRLLGELADYSVVNREWWPLPVVTVLLGLGATVAIGQSMAPLLYVLW